MTLTELRYLIALSEEKHFGRAAEKCFVSQPTLSVAIKKLEDELGVAVFERSKGRIIETEAGKKLLSQARVILDQVSVFKDIAQSVKKGQSGLIKLGAIYTIGPYLFPHLMPALQKNWPEMPFYLEENYTAVLKEKLQACEIDAAIVALPFNEPDVLTSALYDEPFVVLLPKDHELTQFDQISSDMLKAFNVLMLGPGHCFRDQVLSACPEILELANSKGSTAGEQSIVTEGSSLETIRHMVASKLGISILPKTALIEGYYDKTLLEIRPFVEPIPYRTVGIAWRASYPHQETIARLIELIRKTKLVPDTAEANTDVATLVSDESAAPMKDESNRHGVA